MYKIAPLEDHTHNSSEFSTKPDSMLLLTLRHFISLPN